VLELVLELDPERTAVSAVSGSKEAVTVVEFVQEDGLVVLVPAMNLTRVHWGSWLAKYVPNLTMRQVVS
jgi:hypothetical protein